MGDYQYSHLTNSQYFDREVVILTELDQKDKMDQ